MRPKRHEMTGWSDLFRARLDQISNHPPEVAGGGCCEQGIPVGGDVGGLT